MKRILSFLLAIVMLLLLPTTAYAKPGGPKWGGCTTIQSGALVAPDGGPVSMGFDWWGYNYQAHQFQGSYCGFSKGMLCSGMFSGMTVHANWNDAWLSNMDCNGDGVLDQHCNLPTYEGSGAWNMTHMAFSYPGPNGTTCEWSYFAKIVAVPTGSYLVDGMWYAPWGVPIGPDEGEGLAVVMRTMVDTCNGGADQYIGPSGAGLGKWK
jgi:hypothetical protein